ncbi:MAG: 6-bladed beta-propeller [Nitrospirae bacterium]|nr:6-bladed beta-propeller [Nitrospirota bacterium]
MARCRKMILICIITLLAAFTGCASAPEQQSSWDPFKLVWPLPPDKPRIKYLDTLKSSEDVTSAKNIAQSIFGEERTDSLQKPYGVTTDERGRVYVSDVGRIFVFDKGSKKLSFIGDMATVKLIRPLGIFYERKSRLLYVADSSLDKVVVFTADGKLVMEFGQKGELKDPSGVAVDAERDKVYITNTKNHILSVFDTKGAFIKNIGSRGVETGNFNFPTQIALDDAGNIYVVDSGNFRVQVLDSEGKYVRTLGEIGMRFGQFARPKGIGISHDGYIHVTDSSFHGVTVFDKKGTLLLPWGGRGFEKGLFELPAAIHIDEKGHIYVVSQWTAKVDIFQFIAYPEDRELGEKKE